MLDDVLTPPFPSTFSIASLAICMPWPDGAALQPLVDLRFQMRALSTFVAFAAPWIPASLAAIAKLKLLPLRDRQQWASTSHLNDGRQVVPLGHAAVAIATQPDSSPNVLSRRSATAPPGELDRTLPHGLLAQHAIGQPCVAGRLALARIARRQ